MAMKRDQMTFFFFFYELKLYNQTPKQYISTPVKTETLPKGNTDPTTEYSSKIKAAASKLLH
jgi:hypothetical protein